MIKEIQLRRWKSFDDAKLYIDPLTILIGSNAGGKSNALDSLRFLQRIGSGKDLTSAIAGEPAFPGIRGGTEWAALKPNLSFELSVTVEVEGGTEYLFTIEVDSQSRCELVAESLVRIKYRGKSRTNPSKLSLYRTNPVEAKDAGIDTKLYNEKKGTKKTLARTMPILTQIPSQSTRKEILEGVEAVSRALKSIFVFDPIPSHMRSYSPLSDQLLADGSNIAGVLAGTPGEEKSAIEARILQFVQKIPERDIRRIWAEPVGKFNSDAMLYCEEDFGNSSIISTVDARGMSDGTLRFVAIVTALLTRPEQSLLVVEEVDNGLHPSRALLLLQTLSQLGSERHVDVLVTTHNPALLDALEPSLIPCITVAHRDPTSGNSRLTLLEDLQQLPKLLAAGSLGMLASQGRIQSALREFGNPHA